MQAQVPRRCRGFFFLAALSRTSLALCALSHGDGSTGEVREGNPLLVCALSLIMVVM